MGAGPVLLFFFVALDMKGMLFFPSFQPNVRKREEIGVCATVEKKEKNLWHNSNDEDCERSFRETANGKKSKRGWRLFRRARFLIYPQCGITASHATIWRMMAPPCLSGIFLGLFVCFSSGMGSSFYPDNNIPEYNIICTILFREKKKTKISDTLWACVLRHDFSFIKYSSFSRLDIKGENKKGKFRRRKSQKGHGESSKLSCSALTKYKTIRSTTFFYFIFHKDHHARPMLVKQKKTNQPIRLH